MLRPPVCKTVVGNLPALERPGPRDRDLLDQGFGHKESVVPGEVLDKLLVLIGPAFKSSTDMYSSSFCPATIVS